MSLFQYCSTCDRQYTQVYFRKYHAAPHVSKNSYKKGKNPCPRCSKNLRIKSMRIHLLYSCIAKSDSDQQNKKYWTIYKNKLCTKKQIVQIQLQSTQKQKFKSQEKDRKNMSRSSKKSKKNNDLKLIQSNNKSQYSFLSMPIGGLDALLNYSFKDIL